MLDSFTVCYDLTVMSAFPKCGTNGKSSHPIDILVDPTEKSDNTASITEKSSRTIRSDWIENRSIGKGEAANEIEAMNKVMVKIDETNY